MLINAQKPEELRIAIIDGDTLENYQVQVAERGLTRGNIYRGRIASIQPSLNAAFIDYGSERNGFLAIQDVVPQAYYHQPKGGERRRIEAVLDKGRPIVVQVTKEAEGQKGAVLTTNLSLAGRYLVLTPFDSKVGVSRKVQDDDVRKKLRQQAAKLSVPSGCGVIVRTNALDQTKATLTRDLNALLRLWKRIGTAARKGKGTTLLYSDQNLILQALRDHVDSSISEILVDADDAYQQAEEYLRAFMPRSKTRLVRYTEKLPLFARFHLESQIDHIYQRSVDLPSGGSIVIDRTEALTAIDVNSGRSTGGSSQAETALHTNLEAAKEVARQLRLRDIGGLVVVDFIDMRYPKSQRKVEKALRDAMKVDRARHTIGRISSNGLLEINRQRIQQALSVRTHVECPTCQGTGRVASAEKIGLNLLRRIEAQAHSGGVKRVRIALHPEIASSFQNQRRSALTDLERELDIKIEIVADTHLTRPDQEVEWFKRDPKEKSSPKTLEPTVDVAELVTGDPPEDAPSDDKPKRPRKRSRGGRGRGKGRGGNGSDKAKSSEESSAKAEGGNGDGRSRRRRPRRRSRRRSADATAED